MSDSVICAIKWSEEVTNKRFELEKGAWFLVRDLPHITWWWAYISQPFAPFKRKKKTGHVISSF